MHEIIKYLNYEIFREFGIVPDPCKVECIKNVDTSIIINPLYLDHPEALGIFAHMMGERPWDVLCRDSYAKRGKKPYNNSLGKRSDHAWVDRDVCHGHILTSDEIGYMIADACVTNSLQSAGIIPITKKSKNAMKWSLDLLDDIMKG